jgi:hypothetical protein
MRILDTPSVVAMGADLTIQLSAAELLELVDSLNPLDYPPSAAERALQLEIARVGLHAPRNSRRRQEATQ